MNTPMSYDSFFAYVEGRVLDARKNKRSLIMTAMKFLSQETISRVDTELCEKLHVQIDSYYKCNRGRSEYIFKILPLPEEA